MEREKVRSSNIRSIGYDPEQSTLEVEFGGGSIYQYNNVQQQLFERFLAATSKGKFFSANIRDKYSARKIR